MVGGECGGRCVGKGSLGEVVVVRGELGEGVVMRGECGGRCVVGSGVGWGRRICVMEGRHGEGDVSRREVLDGGRTEGAYLCTCVCTILELLSNVG